MQHFYLIVYQKDKSIVFESNRTMLLVKRFRKSQVANSPFIRPVLAREVVFMLE